MWLLLIEEELCHQAKIPYVATPRSWRKNSATKPKVPMRLLLMEEDLCRQAKSPYVATPNGGRTLPPSQKSLCGYS